MSGEKGKKENKEEEEEVIEIDTSKLQKQQFAGFGGAGGPQFAFNFDNVAFDFGRGGGAGGNAPAFNLVSAIQERLGTLVGKSSGYLESLPEPVQKRVKALEALHEQYEELDTQFNKEVEELKKKYEALYRPLWAKRASFVTGAAEPTEEETKTKKPEPPKEEKEEEKKEEKEKAKEGEKKEEEPVPKGIPSFWLEAIRNHEELIQLLSGEQDEEALKFLEDISYEPVEGEPASFTLVFKFAPNPFFNNTVLTKTYHLKEEDPEEGPLFQGVKSTPIEWKEGKNLAVKLVKKKVKAKGGRRGRGKKPTEEKTVEEKCETFFNFFLQPTPEEAEKEGLAPEDYEEMMSGDYGLALEFRHRLIPDAVKYFTGEAIGNLEGEFDEDDEDDEEGGFGEEDDEDEDDEEEDEEIPPRRGGGGRRGGRGQSRAQGHGHSHAQGHGHSHGGGGEYKSDEDDDFDPKKPGGAAGGAPQECKNQ